MQGLHFGCIHTFRSARYSVLTVRNMFHFSWWIKSRRINGRSLQFWWWRPSPDTGVSSGRWRIGSPRTVEAKGQGKAHPHRLHAGTITHSGTQFPKQSLPVRVWALRHRQGLASDWDAGKSVVPEQTHEMEEGTRRPHVWRARAVWTTVSNSSSSLSTQYAQSVILPWLQPTCVSTASFFKPSLPPPRVSNFIVMTVTESHLEALWVWLDSIVDKINYYT